MKMLNNKLVFGFFFLLLSSFSFSGDIIIDYIYSKTLNGDHLPDDTIILLCDIYNQVGDEDKIINLINYIESNNNRVVLLNRIALHKFENRKNGPLYSYLKELGNRSVEKNDYSVMIPLIKYFYRQDQIVFEKLISYLFEVVPSSKIAVLDRAFWAIDLLDLLKREKMYAYINSIYKIVEALLGDNAIASQDKYQVARKFVFCTKLLSIQCPLIVENAMAKTIDLNDTEEVLFMLECSRNFEKSSFDIFMTSYHEKLKHLFQEEDLEGCLIYLYETKSNKMMFLEAMVRSLIDNNVRETLNLIIDHDNKNFNEINMLNLKMLLSMGYYNISEKYAEALDKKYLSEQYKSTVNENRWIMIVCKNINYYETYNYLSIVEEILRKGFDANLKIELLEKMLTNKKLTNLEKNYIGNNIFKVIHDNKNIDLKLVEKVIEKFIKMDELSKGVNLLLETPKNELDSIAITLSKRIIESYEGEVSKELLEYIKLHNNKIVPYILSKEASKLIKQPDKKEMERSFIRAIDLSEKNNWLYINEIIENYKNVFKFNPWY